MDDVGASSKQFEVYSKRFLGNVLFLKYYWPFKAWGPYRELDQNDWRKILAILKCFNMKITVGMTACWVEKDNSLVSYPEKFPKAAEVIKQGVKEGFLEVANHGLTHCIIGKHLPKLFNSNRKFHREFYYWVDKEIQTEHIKRSQEILQNFFDTRVITFIPPGGVWIDETEKIAVKHGLKYLCASSAKTGKKSNGIVYIGDEVSLTFHDRDLIINEVHWLKEKLIGLEKKSYEVATVKEFIRHP